MKTVQPMSQNSPIEGSRKCTLKLNRDKEMYIKSIANTITYSGITNIMQFHLVRIFSPYPRAYTHPLLLGTRVVFYYYGAINNVLKICGFKKSHLSTTLILEI